MPPISIAFVVWLLAIGVPCTASSFTHSPPTVQRDAIVSPQNASSSSNNRRRSADSSSNVADVAAAAAITVVRKRESPAVDFTWKTTSKPNFVTSKMKKVEPILTVYPPDVVYRSGRARELMQPLPLHQHQHQHQHQQQHLHHHHPNGLKRVIYYATLPDISRYVPPPTPSDRRFAADYGGGAAAAPLTQQRSYDPNKAGKDFVTRVQSTVIDVRPRGDKKKSEYQTPSFTIIDAGPAYADPFDRIAVLNGGGGIGGGVGGGTHFVQPMMAYHQRPPSPPPPPPPPPPPMAAIAIEPPSLLYYSNGHFMRPYHHADAQKLVSTPMVADNRYNLYTTYTASSLQQSPPPYPTRHNRFPADRYPPGSPIAAILGPAAVAGQRPTAVDAGGAPHRYQQSVGLEAPVTSTTGATWLPTSSLELGGDHVGPSSLEHGSSPLDADGPAVSRPLSYKNKFSAHLDHSTSPFGQKYTDFGTFNTDFAIRPPSSSSPGSFKPHFSQVSDWLTNKPSLDLSTFELEDFNNALASNAAATGHESSSSAPASAAGSSGGSVDPFNELMNNNTIITPYLASFPNTSSSESQDD